MRAKLKALKEATVASGCIEADRDDRGMAGVGAAWVTTSTMACRGNYRRLDTFRHRVRRLWQRALSRRSQKGRITEERMDRIAARWLPKPRICHPYPEVRLAVIIQGKSPVR